MMAEEKKPEEAVETADDGQQEDVAAVAEEAPQEPATESQTVLDHRAKLKRMDETRGF